MRLNPGPEMRKRVVAIDVDLTVVDTLTPWLYWFSQKTGLMVHNKDRAYDLVPEMLELIKESGVEPFDPMEYWKHPNLYDMLQPAPGSVEVVNRLKEQYEVVFVSSCIPEHTDSKIRFLKKYFGKDIKFISTFHKEFVEYHFLIDDRLHHIRVGKMYRPHAGHILFTGYRQDGTDAEREEVLASEFSSWKQILNFFFID